MKRLSKILAVTLAVLMTASVFCIPIFAEETPADPYAALKEGIGYVAIGDSFARGFGASDHYKDQIYRNDGYGDLNTDHGDYNCRNVDGSYPYLVAQEFGLNTPADIRDKSAQMWPLAHDAVSTAYMLDLLGIDDGYRDTEFTYNASDMMRRYETDLRYFGAKESFTVDGEGVYGQDGEIMNVREMLAEASLITIGLGQTDIIYKAQTLGLNPIIAGETEILDGVTDILSRLNRYFDYWKDAYPLLLDFIKENNPDAKVVLVGTMNPIKNVVATDDIGIKIGNLLNVIMDSMNNYTKQCALKYGYMYVDISDVDTPSSVKRMSLSEMFSLTGDDYAELAHPTANGYKQIADRVIEVVKADLEMDSIKADFNLTAFFKALFALIKNFFENFLCF